MSTDTQITELEGRSILERQLFAQGWEVAQPRRDNGIDLVAYRTSGERFEAVPIQVKVSTKGRFEVHKKYGRIPGLRLVYVFLTTEEIYSLTYAETVEVLTRMGYANSLSWEKDGRYSAATIGPKLLAALAPYKGWAVR